MKCKEKALLISIVLYFFLAFGYIIQNEFRAAQSEDLPFGPSIETSFHHDKILAQEESPATEYLFCDLTNTGDALRRFVQTKRAKSSPSSKTETAFIKRKHLLFILHHFAESSKTYPSRLTEARQYLISLRKLII